MIEMVTLGLFVLSLILCIVTGMPVLYALCFGLVIFIVYARIKKHTFPAILRMLWDGVKQVKNILIIFVLIGMLTASWRAGGTISYIISNTIGYINPQFFVVWTFLLCALISVLTGTAFGTASTMGFICMMLARTAGINPLIAAGAALSGAFFGDRCSPMSSSAALVAAMTKTNIYTNIKNMIKTSVLPLILTIAGFIALSLTQHVGAIQMDTINRLKEVFSLPFWTLLPAIVIIVLSLFRVDVKISMLCSVVISVVLCFTVQHMSLLPVLKTLWGGFDVGKSEPLLAMLNGGGIISMATVACIVSISSAFSGIFRATGLLDGLIKPVRFLNRKTGTFVTTFITSTLTASISCNQALGILLCSQINESIYQSKEQLAVDLENTVVVVAPLIPWNIAGAVPLATLGVTAAALPFSLYLIMIPLVNGIIEYTKFLIKKKKINAQEGV